MCECYVNIFPFSIADRSGIGFSINYANNIFYSINKYEIIFRNNIASDELHSIEAFEGDASTRFRAQVL
jgi:hypothetical protein